MHSPTFTRLIAACALTVCALLSAPLFSQGPVSPTGKQGPLKIAPIRVISSHETRISFPARIPYGRRLAVTATKDGVSLKAGERVTYDLVLPDFAVDADMDRATLRMNATGTLSITINGAKAVEGPCAGACARAGRAMRAWSADTASAAEMLIEITAGEDGVVIHGADSNDEAALDPALVVHTRKSLGRAVGFTVRERVGLELPAMRPLLPIAMRDTSIRPGGDGYYYMTGTTGGPDWWTVTSNIQMWKSQDLKMWTPVVTSPRAQSTVWNIDRQGTWQKSITMRDGQPFRPVWAPEIHYLKGTYWIPYCIPRLGTGLLKSTTGKPEGPYASVLVPDQPLTDGIDASLFQDDDGAVYFLWGGNNIARMKDDMTGLAEKPRTIGPLNRPNVGFEGISLFKLAGIYYLSGADFIVGEYHCFTASSKALFGPYSERYLSVPHGGHNNFFEDKSGRLWSTFFGNDLQAPFLEQPGIVPMKLDSKGRLRPDLAPRD